MFVSAVPGALLWPAAMIVWGPGEATSAHAHHCVQLVMAVEGILRIRGGPSEEWMDCGAALVKPDTIHGVDARDTVALIAFVDAESALGAALAERGSQGITRITMAEVAQWRTRLGPAATLNQPLVERWIREELLRNTPPAKIHPGVRRVLRHLREQIGGAGPFTLSGLAAIAGLSSSRLMHVFTESVGVPPRPYILWLRLQRASGELMKGASVTEAAHAAGFSDAAHMTRTFRRMLGTTPAELAARRASSRAALIQAN